LPLPLPDVSLSARSRAISFPTQDMFPTPAPVALLDLSSFSFPFMFLSSHFFDVICTQTDPFPRYPVRMTSSACGPCLFFLISLRPFFPGLSSKHAGFPPPPSPLIFEDAFRVRFLTRSIWVNFSPLYFFFPPDLPVLNTFLPAHPFPPEVNRDQCKIHNLGSFF